MKFKDKAERDDYYAKVRFDNEVLLFEVEHVNQLHATYQDCGTHQLLVTLHMYRRELRVLRDALNAMELDRS